MDWFLDHLVVTVLIFIGVVLAILALLVIVCLAKEGRKDTGQDETFPMDW